MIEFAEERFHDVIGEAGPLLQKHWEEIARNRDTVPLAIDHIAYAKSDERGQLLICTARDSGRLIGYAVYFLFPHGHHHYRKTPWAMSDIFWLDRGLRLPRIALRLFEFVEAALRKRGIVIVHTNTKNAHPAAGRLLAKLGHLPIETVYAKKLT